jgi:hypothetical protein
MDKAVMVLTYLLIMVSFLAIALVVYIYKKQKEERTELLNEYREVKLFRYKYEEQEDGIIITGADFSSKKDRGSIVLRIPSDIYGKKVLGIADSAFQYNELLYKVIIHNAIKIGKNAFKGCTKLVIVSIHNVETIDDYAFYGCESLRQINISNSSNLKYIGESAFECKVSSKYEDNYSIMMGGIGESLGPPKIYLNLPSKLKRIGKNAFKDSNISNVTIPDFIEHIGENAFEDCIQLETVKIGEMSFWKVIEEGTFSRCTSLEHINLPESITHISEYAFYNCKNLKSIIVPKSIETIDEYAFHGCENLELIYKSKDKE